MGKMGWLIGNDPDAGKDWRQEEKGVAEDEMVGWHHRLNGQEFEQTPGDSEGPGSLVCCSPWGCKESDTTKQLNNSNSSSRNSEKHFNVLTRLVICYKKNVTQKQTSERDEKGICRGEVGWGGRVEVLHAVFGFPSSTISLCPSSKKLSEPCPSGFLGGLRHDWLYH